MNLEDEFLGIMVDSFTETEYLHLHRYTEHMVLAVEAGIPIDPMGTPLLLDLIAKYGDDQ